MSKRSRRGWGGTQTGTKVGPECSRQQGVESGSAEVRRGRLCREDIYGAESNSAWLA